ncbi:hypothetical protein ACWEOA_01535 [Streptomyces sp. NPDC004457]
MNNSRLSVARFVVAAAAVAAVAVPVAGFADGTGRADAAVTVSTDTPASDASVTESPEPGFGWG